MLEITGVHKSFERLRAVDGASLVVPRGRIVGLIGPNGSGKSTLFSLIAGAQRADGGHIVFDGHDITHAGPDRIFQLGLVRGYQDPALFFRMTALDNVLLPVKGQVGERARWAPIHRAWRTQEGNLAQAGLDLLDRAQLRSHAVTLASELSGGQMKLLELGRSINGAPKLLLLDEPTAGVAPKLARDIFERIAQLRRDHGLTLFVVEHRLEVLFDFADEIYVMHLGRVVAHGRPAEIATDRQVKEIYLGD
jgi:branched-chain amino acid transport system ATP-binding protein